MIQLVVEGFLIWKLMEEVNTTKCMTNVVFKKKKCMTNVKGPKLWFDNKSSRLQFL